MCSSKYAGIMEMKLNWIFLNKNVFKYLYLKDCTFHERREWLHTIFSIIQLQENTVMLHMPFNFKIYSGNLL